MFKWLCKLLLNLLGGMKNNQKETKEETKPIEPSDYDLKIDTQVERFVEIKQKLTYFLITASAAAIVFLYKFLVDHFYDAGNLVWFAIFSTIAGLLTSGFSLVNIRLEHQSFTLHLKNRYLKKTWESLSSKEQNEWDRIKEQASCLLTVAIICLFIEFGFAAAFLIWYFLKLHYN